jgi:hypothetical protein
MQESRTRLQNSLHGVAMATSWRSVLGAVSLITITLHSLQPASANESNHKVRVKCQDRVHAHAEKAAFARPYDGPKPVASYNAAGSQTSSAF